MNLDRAFNIILTNLKISKILIKCVKSFCLVFSVPGTIPNGVTEKYVYICKF